MSDNERGELSERVAVLEALLKKHEEGALSRKAEISEALVKITDKLNAQQCSAHALNVLSTTAELTRLKDRTIPEIATRVTDIEHKMWIGLGGLGVLMAFLKWFIK